eukprot:2279986-Alexandrium_andersonii.AAC.1
MARPCQGMTVSTCWCDGMWLVRNNLHGEVLSDCEFGACAELPGGLPVEFQEAPGTAFEA